MIRKSRRCIVWFIEKYMETSRCNHTYHEHLKKKLINKSLSQLRIYLQNSISIEETILLKYNRKKSHRKNIWPEIGNRRLSYNSTPISCIKKNRKKMNFSLRFRYATNWQFNFGKKCSNSKCMYYISSCEWEQNNKKEKTHLKMKIVF